MTEMCFKIVHELDNWVTCSEAWWDTVPEHWSCFGKCSSPKVTLFIFGSTRSRVLSLLDPQSTLHWRRSLRYTGVRLFRALYVRSRTLYSICCQMGNQWSFFMVGEMWWYFPDMWSAWQQISANSTTCWVIYQGDHRASSCSSLVYWWLGHVPQFFAATSVTHSLILYILWSWKKHLFAILLICLTINIVLSTSTSKVWMESDNITNSLERENGGLTAWSIDEQSD